MAEQRGLCMRCRKNERDTVSVWCKPCRAEVAGGGVDRAELSRVRTETQKVAVYPTGYDQSPWADRERNWVLYVERYPDTGRWRVHDGYRIMTHKGTMTHDRPQVRHLTRFDQFETALAAAVRHVDEVFSNRERLPMIPSNI